MKRLVAKFRQFPELSDHVKATTDHASSQSPPTLSRANPEATADTASASTAHETLNESCDSRFETLPAEVRRHLLSSCDLPRLKALVRASPTFHQQYLLDRRYLLYKSIENTLGSVTVEAYAAHLFGPKGKEAKAEVTRLLTKSSATVSRPRISLADMLTQDEAIGVAAFYLHLVKPVMGYYAHWVLNNLARETGKDSDSRQQKQSLSNMEATRVARAIYHFQLLCQFVKFDDRRPVGSSRDSIARDFLAIFEPWEIEQLLSFIEFAEGVYDKILADIVWDLHPDNPKFDDQHRPPTPEGAFDLSLDLTRSGYIEGTSLLGVSLLHAVLFEIKDHQTLVTTMQEHMRSSYIPLNAIEGAFGETQQAANRENRSSWRDQMREDREPFLFRGDSDPDAPPQAWTTIWKETYSNLYGWYTSDEMRRWGYIFWDADRLAQTGGMELLKRQWEELWDDDDPRDDLH